MDGRRMPTWIRKIVETFIRLFVRGKPTEIRQIRFDYCSLTLKEMTGAGNNREINDQSLSKIPILLNSNIISSIIPLQDGGHLAREILFLSPPSQSSGH